MNIIKLSISLNQKNILYDCDIFIEIFNQKYFDYAKYLLANFNNGSKEDYIDYFKNSLKFNENQINKLFTNLELKIDITISYTLDEEGLLFKVNDTPYCFYAIYKDNKYVIYFSGSSFDNFNDFQNFVKDKFNITFYENFEQDLIANFVMNKFI